MSEEEVLVEHLKNQYKESIKNNATIMTLESAKVEMFLNLIEKQQKLINTFISNEAVREGKDFNEIKEKYYECL